MSRPRSPSPVRLPDVRPDEVADEIVGLVVDHLGSAVLRLDPTVVLQIPEDAGALGLRATARALAAYAQRGLPCWDWQDHGDAADALLEVVTALYGHADARWERGLGGILDVLDDVEPDRPLDVVLLAALARISIDRRHGVAQSALAALAGVSPRTIRHDLAEGRLYPEEDGRRGSPVDWRSAERWLRERGVPGYAPR